MNELEQIIQRMISAGESEEKIALVIKEYNSKLDTEGKLTSQGPGAPVAETAAPNQISTESTLEDGSLASEEISVEEKKLLPFNVRNEISSTTGDFSRANVEKVTAEINEKQNTPINEKFFGDGSWYDNLGKVKENYLGKDGFGGEVGPGAAAILKKMSAASTSFFSEISRADNKLAKDILLRNASPEKAKEILEKQEKAIENIDELSKKQYKELIGLQKQTEKLGIFTVTDPKAAKSFMDGISGLAASGATVGESVVPAIIAGAVGTVVAGPAGGTTASIAVSNSMLGSNFVTEHNTTKAKSLYPDLTEEEAIAKLIDNGEAEFLKPMAVAAPAMALEAVGIKGITKYLASQKGLMKNLGGLMWASNGEGLTESFQAPIEEYNKLIAAGKDPLDAVAESAQFFKDNFAKTYLEAFAGTLIFSGLGKGAKFTAKTLRSAASLNSKIDEEKIENTINEIGDLNIKKLNSTTTEAKEAIELKIKDKQEELKGFIAKAASIMDFASDKDLDEVSTMEELKKVYLKKVIDLNNKKDLMPTEEYLDAIEIYKEKFLEIKNKINGVANNVKEKHTQAYTNLQELYNKYEGNQNKLVSETLTKDTKGNNVNEKVESSIFGQQVGALAERITKRLFDPITPDARNGVTRQEYKRTVISNAAVQLAGFKPEKGKTLDQYMSFTMNARANSLAKELGIESIQEQGGMGIAQDVTTVKDAMATETSEDTVERSERVKETATRAKIIDQLSFRSKGLNLFSDAAKKALSGKLPPVTDARAFKAALDDAFRTALTLPMKNFSGTRKDYDRFLNENWKQLYDIIPQDVINKRFDEFKVPIIDPRTGKQKRLTMAEGTAAGELVFGKKDITKEEFINYMQAKGSTKAARKNALSEMLATQIGFDEVLEALADPEINKKFKDIQGLQGQEVPANYGARVAKIVDRLDEYAKMLERDPNILSASFGLDIVLQTAFVKAIKALSFAIKNGAKFADAIAEFRKNLSKEFVSEAYKKKAEDLTSETFQSIEDLNKTSINKFGKKLAELSVSELQEIGVEKGHIATLNNRIKNANSEAEIISIIKAAINFEQKAVKTNSGLFLEKNQYSSNLKYFNKILKPILEQHAPKLLGDKNSGNGFHLANILNKKTGKPLTFKNKETGKLEEKLTVNFNESISREAASTNKSEVKKRNITELENRRLANKKYLNDLLDYYEKTGDKEAAISHFKVLTMDQDGPLRRMAKVNLIVDNYKGETTLEHNPPVTLIYEKIVEAINNPSKRSELNTVLENYTQNLLPKPLADILDAKGLKESMPKGKNILDNPNARYETAAFKKEAKKYKFTEVNSNKTKTEQANQPIVEAEINATETVTPPSDKESRVMASAIDDMVQRKKGISKERTVSAVEAKAIGKGKGRFKIFIPPSAEDFKGLIYSLMGSGKQGDIDAEFFSEKLFKPLAKANYILNAERQNLKAKFKNLIDNNKGITKELRKESGYSFFSNDHAVRVFMWNKLGYEIPGLSGKEQSALIKIVEDNPKLKKFAEEIIVIPNKNESWLQPKEEWAASTVEMDLQETISKTGRKRIFAEFIQNADIIFNENALNKLEAAYGTPYINALKSMIKRIETGRSNESTMGTSESAFLNWVRGSVATTMFFNTRSALLQQLSLVNFTNWADNNPAAQAKAMANTKQWGKDWAMIFNSDWMKERRQGLKTDINESELVASLEGSNNSYKSLLNTLLKNGFALTKYGDNIAIATGGAAFFRNRANAYAKKGMSKEAAEKQAFLDFQEIAEETQQSSRQDLLSNQQVTTFGKFFLAFANTPMQMTRLTKKAFLDLANGRGDAKSNISKIVYYGAVQNMIFSALQNALFAAIFSDEDDEEDEKLIDGKTERAINNVLDSLLRGSGIAGSAIATVKNVILRAQKEFNKGYKGDDTYILLEAANIAPPIGIKARKLYGAYKNYKMNQKTVKYIGFDNINHPYYGIAGATASGVLNIPLDRVITKANNLKEAFDSQNEAWQRIALSLGYSTWELGIRDEEIDAARKKAKKRSKKAKSTGIKGIKSNKIKNVKIKT